MGRIPPLQLWSEWDPKDSKKDHSYHAAGPGTQQAPSMGGHSITTQTTLSNPWRKATVPQNPGEEWLD